MAAAQNLAPREVKAAVLRRTLAKDGALLAPREDPL
jgi:hypothetical protein